jgi:hypothetical protein
LVWPADALSFGGIILGIVAGTLSYAGTKIGGQAEGAPWMLWMSASLPVLICLWLGSGVGFYLTGFYAAGLLQALLMSRRPMVSAPAE